MIHEFDTFTAMTSDIAPFKVVETTPGNFSLLLSEFGSTSAAFEAVGSDGGGYAWEAVARHVVEHVAPELEGRVGFDPEGSMFCAYGNDRAALEALAVRLAGLFHDQAALASTIAAIGPDGFDD